MNRKGLTLIEVVLTIAIFSIVIIVSFSLLGISSKPHKIISNEFSIQSNVRIIMQKLTDYVVDSSAIFIHDDIEDVFTDNDIYSFEINSTGVVKVDEEFVTKFGRQSEFKDALEKYKGWNFLTLSADGKELREFIYKEEDGKGYYEFNRVFDRKLTDELDIVFEIDFKKNSTNYEDNLLSFQLVGKNSDKDKEQVNITTEIKAINTLQVVDRSGYKPGKVLFFRNNLDAQAAIAMVLDKSGSMKEYTSVNGKSISKISALKDQAEELIDSFSALDNAEISLIPFSTNANNPLGLTSSRDTITLNSFLNKNLSYASGGTNIGDGIRRAYHILKKYNDESLANREANKYLIILMDGVPTYASVKGKEEFADNNNLGLVYKDDSGHEWYNYKIKRERKMDRYLYIRPTEYVLDSNNINNKSILIGDGGENEYSIYFGIQYIKELEKKLNNINNLKIYLIGFFTKTGPGKIEDTLEYKQFKEIEKILSKPGREVDGYISNNGDQLNMAINDIEESIIGNYWRIYGPKQYKEDE
jgi:prepilin-type N-terminal cleavage/methylation domain-containing protein